MIQKILTSTNPKLRIVSKQITRIDKKVLALIEDLKDTLSIQKDPEGVGLAAPQIGKNLRIFLMNHGGIERVVINPEILEAKRIVNKEPGIKNKGKIMEGCLSLPHYYGGIKRANYIKLKYQRPTLDAGHWRLETLIEEFKGFFAQIVLHEIDHLGGILFIDRLLAQKKPLYKLVGGEWEEVEI